MKHSATYSPEDNKLRLYPAHRLSAEDFATIKAAGFSWAPKQELFVAPSWTPAREDLLLDWCDEIDDEDYSPEERAADRAERFSGYRDKRREEAGGHADAFDAGPSAFGHQNRARAERQAARHDRHRTRAASQWSKAEYWQDRTAGVIRNALHKSSASVRRGRILRLEAELRSKIAEYTPADEPPHYIMQTGWNDTDPSQHVWCGPKGHGGRWVKVASLEDIKAGNARWVEHYENRLNYERAMLAAEGGSAADADIVPGGWFGKHQVQAVNRSPATGRVVSVKLLAPKPYWRGEGPAPLTLQSFNVERFGESAYREPTEEELAAFKVATTERKKAEKAAKPAAPSLLNPTDEDAQRLQDHWNAWAKIKHDKAKAEHRIYSDFIPTQIVRLTQAQYSQVSKGTYRHFETVDVCEHGFRARNSHWEKAEDSPVAFKVRKAYARTNCTTSPDAVVVITDKPRKGLPLDWDSLPASPAPLTKTLG